jgi:hypothetical protein
VDDTRYQTYYKRIQNLVSKPSVHEAMRNKDHSKPTKPTDTAHRKELEHNKTIERQKMQMDILLMQEESKGQKKDIIESYDKEESEKSKLLESDIRSQSFSLEKRLAKRRFSQNKRILTRSHSSCSFKENQCLIGTKDESMKEEYSSIMQNGNSKLEDSWNMESKVLLSNLNQGMGAHTLANFTCGEIIFEEDD